MLEMMYYAMMPSSVASLATAVGTIIATNATAAALMTQAVSQWMAAETYLPQTVDFAPFPTFAYQNNGFYAIMSQVFAFFFTLLYLFPVSRFIRGLVSEKESRIREGMRMMGLGNTALTGSWFATYAILHLLIAAAITIVTKFNIFKVSQGGYVFIVFFLYGLSTISYGYLISVFFSKAKTASTLGSILFFGGFL